MIDAGKLRERVAFQTSSETRNALGETVPVWTTFAERWASVEGVSAREALTFGQQNVSVTHRVRLRYVPGLTTQMRVLWRGRLLEIVSLLEHGNRSEHELICQENS